MKYDLSTFEGQYAAGLYVAKNYFSKSKRVESRINHLTDSALIHRIEADKDNPKYNHGGLPELVVAWYNGINEGKRIRK
jgi:hypothetical protein